MPRRRRSPAFAGYQPPPALFLFDRRISQPAARDIPLVPEPGTAWRRDIHRHDLAEGKAGALKGLATRNPMLLFSLDGSLSLRFEERRLFSLLFQEPPRSPRDEPDFFLTRDAVPVFCRPTPPPASANCRHATHGRSRSARST